MTGRILLLAVLLLAGRPAAADVVFTFNQTGSTPGGAVTASGSITLSDAAFASGVSISQNHMLPQADWTALGILGLNFVTNGFSRLRKFAARRLISFASLPRLLVFSG